MRSLSPESNQQSITSGTLFIVLAHFGQVHVISSIYGLCNSTVFAAGLPLNFSSSSLEPMFYSLMAESTLLFNRSPYENVIVLGHVQDENGQKMSKSKGLLRTRSSRTAVILINQDSLA